jgi:hypothetical protein
MAPETVLVGNDEEDLREVVTYDLREEGYICVRS